MPASLSIIYPVSTTLVQASPQAPLTISVGGNGSLSYGATTALGATLAAGQTMTVIAPKYIRTTSNNSPVSLRTYEAWEVPAHDKDVTADAGQYELSVMEFGAVADGAIGDTGTDNYAAFQAALNASEILGGGVVRVPRGRFRIDSPLVMEQECVRLIGEGRTASVLYISHNDGPAIRVRKEFSEVSHIRIIASTAREASASGNGTQALNCGVLIEPEDVASPGEAHNIKMEGVTISDHPSHGLVICADGASKDFNRVQVSRCKGHGIWVDNGTQATGRSNVLAQPSGFCQFSNCDVAQNGGHGMVIGHPSDDYGNSPGAPTRVTIDQLDCGDNCTDAAMLLSGTDADDQLYIFGQDIAVRNSGFASSIYCMGKSIEIANNRFTDSPTRCVTVENHVEFTTNGVRISDMHPIGATPNPAVVIDSAAAGVQIDQSASTNISDLGTGDLASFAKGFGTATVSRPWRFISGITSQNTGLGIADDAVAKIVFSDQTEGVAVVNGQEANDEGGVFMFRVGPDAFCSVIASTTAANVTASSGAGALSGTGGTDGDLNIYANSSTPELYVNNRLGASGTYRVTLLGIDPAVRVTADLALVP